MLETILLGVLLVFTLLLSIYLYVRNAFLSAVFQLLFNLFIRKFTGKSKEYIYKLEDITPQWLNAALGVQYPDTFVGSVSCKVMGDDMGNASLMFRLRIDYDSNPHDLPVVMIMKVWLFVSQFFQLMWLFLKLPWLFLFELWCIEPLQLCTHHYRLRKMTSGTESHLPAHVC